MPVQLPIPVPRRPIVGNGGAVCPAWSPSDAEPRADEGESIDLALTLAYAAAVRRSRDALLRELAAASAANPNDAWITGQRVRFLIDQQQFPQAVAVARACTGDSALCADLTGVAYHYAGDIVAADSAFRDSEALRNAGPSVNATADHRDPLFSVALGLLPVTDHGDRAHLVLPALSLSLSATAASPSWSSGGTC